mgnify:CR=1 FL=1
MNIHLRKEKDEYHSLLAIEKKEKQDLEEEETAGGFIDPEVYLSLEIDLVSGSLSNEDVNAQWKNRKITTWQHFGQHQTQNIPSHLYNAPDAQLTTEKAKALRSPTSSS